MKTKKVGNIFQLAEKQLLSEIDSGKRKIKWHSIEIQGKTLIRPYSFVDLVDYIIIIRKQLSRYGKTGTINKVKNIKTGEFVELETKQEVRHRKYFRETEGRKRCI